MSNENSGNPGGGEVSGLLVQGFKAAKENHRDEAYNIFCDVVRRDPNNELGWLYRAATTDDLSEAYVCLQRVLSINPNNEKAQRGIERIQARLNSEDGEETPAATDAAAVATRPQYGTTGSVWRSRSSFRLTTRPDSASDKPLLQENLCAGWQLFGQPIYRPLSLRRNRRGGDWWQLFQPCRRQFDLPDVPQTNPPPYRPDPQARLALGNR